MRPLHHLNEIEEILHQKKPEFRHIVYAVPRPWVESLGKRPKKKIVKVNPCEFFIEAFEHIRKMPKEKIKKTRGGNWSREAIVYNIFVRTTCAFDHNQNGKLDLPLNRDGWRETGTFLKAIALLPYIKSLGTNTVYFLPITSVGSDGSKGTLGSPYAIKNPYKLDSNLSEPNLGIGTTGEFKAFVEAAHHLGIRVVVEFVFRTSAKDSDWIKEHPEWFYWIKADIKDRKPGDHNIHHYGVPVFTEAELKVIIEQVESGNFDGLIPPHQEYRSMFTLPPPVKNIKYEHGKYIGTLANGTRVRIPSAFADWPPHDIQPAWNDVTYLKMYDHPDFNYIAYNTLRMYDTRLAKRENVNRPLWEKIAGIIPYYQKTYGIDGVMIDMGHALPMELKQEIIRRARKNDPDFAFWDENFNVSEQSLKEGYNAVIGYCWADQHRAEKLKDLLRRFAHEGYPIAFFATPESHNTPRAAARSGGIIYSKFAWAINNFIPAIPFIHSGFEIGEKFPINTGLDFSKEDLAKYPSAKLPLFSEYAYDWTSSDKFTQWVRKVASIRKKYQELILDSSPQSFIWIETHQQDVIAFQRVSPKANHSLLVIANTNMQSSAHCLLSLETRHRVLTDLLSDKKVHLEHKSLKVTLSAGQVLVFEL